MKKWLLLTFALVAGLGAQLQAPYHVVFDLTSGDTTDHRMALRWLKEISESKPAAKLELVLYGQSLALVTQQSSMAEEVRMLAAKPNIYIRVCEIAMKKHNITAADLIIGVKRVPDGIYEIVIKQKQGWAYIKAAR